MSEVEIGQKRRLNQDNECSYDNLENEKQLTKLQDATTHADTSNTPTTKNNEKPNSMASVKSPMKINEEFNQIKLNWAHTPGESITNKFFNSDNKYNSGDKKSLLEKLELRSERKIKRKLNEEKCKDSYEKENDNIVEISGQQNEKSAKNEKVITNADALAIKACSKQLLDQGNKVYRYLADLSQHNECLRDYDKGLRKDLKDRLLFKTKMNESYNMKVKELDYVFDHSYGQMRKDIRKSKEISELQAKRALDEIINLKQREDEVAKHIEKLKKEREERLAKANPQKSNDSKQKEAETMQKRVEKIQVLNNSHFRQLNETKVINEHLSYLKNKQRSYCVLWPKIIVNNPWSFESYLKVSKHHNNLTLMNNEKILAPEKYCVINTQDRVGNVENYIQQTRLDDMIEDSIQKGRDLFKEIAQNCEQDFEDKDGLKNSNENLSIEKDILSLDDFQIKPKNLGFEQPVPGKNGQQFMSLEHNYKFEYHNPENSCYSDHSRDFLKQLNPEPVKVFNNMVKLKRMSKNKGKSSNFHMVLKFDNIITDDYMTTFYDMNVVLKLYSDIEFFIKGLLYTNIGEIYKQIPPFSSEYNYVFGQNNQKKDFNLHYHTDLPECNTNNEAGEQLLQQNGETEEPLEKSLKQQIEKMKFTKIELSGSQETHNKKPLQIQNVVIENEVSQANVENTNKIIEEEVENCQSNDFVFNDLGVQNLQEEQKDLEKTYGIIFMGDKNRGLFKELIKVIYEDLKDFNVYTINVQGVSFQIDTFQEHEDNTISYDNFADFINKFESDIKSMFYNVLLAITVNIEIGSKIDPLHSSSKKLKFIVLPTNMFEANKDLSKQIREVIIQKSDEIKRSGKAKNTVKTTEIPQVDEKKTENLEISKDEPVIEVAKTTISEELDDSVKYLP